MCRDVIFAVCFQSRNGVVRIWYPLGTFGNLVKVSLLGNCQRAFRVIPARGALRLQAGGWLPAHLAPVESAFSLWDDALEAGVLLLST